MERRILVYLAPYWIGVGILRKFSRQIRKTQFQEISGTPILSGERDKARYQENLLRLILFYPYRKPTQVDRASSPRGTGESSLRNSAKQLDVSSQDVSPVSRDTGRS